MKKKYMNIEYNIRKIENELKKIKHIPGVQLGFSVKKL
jgi:hypothetical protein